MPILIVTPRLPPTPEERAHNRALIERYMPGFAEFFMEARGELDAYMQGEMKFRIPDADLPFVRTLMDDTKRLVM